MSEDMRLPSSAASATSGSPRRRELRSIANAGSRDLSEREATTCNKRRAALPEHEAANRVSKGATAFHDNRKVLGPRDFNVAMMCRACCRSGSLWDLRPSGIYRWKRYPWQNMPHIFPRKQVAQNRPILERFTRRTPPETAARRTT